MDITITLDEPAHMLILDTCPQEAFERKTVITITIEIMKGDVSSEGVDLRDQILFVI